MDNLPGISYATSLLTSKSNKSKVNNNHVDKAYHQLKKEGFNVKEITVMKSKYNNKTIEELKKMRKQLDIIVGDK